VGIVLNPREKRALIGFLLLYTLSAFLLMGIIGFLYYTKELVLLEEQCTMEMRNAAMMLKDDLMKAQLDPQSIYRFTPPQKEGLRAGLFDANGDLLYSNLESKHVLLSKEAYKSATHEYHIDHLDTPRMGISYIVIETREGEEMQRALIRLIILTLFFSTLFIAFIGYLLSRMLLQPIRNRMEELNRFIKDSAHEINTPISALMMSLSTLRSIPQIPSRTRNHITISAKRIFEIYNSLSFIAFHEHEQALDEHFDLAQSVHEGVKFFEELAALKGNTFTCKLEQTMVFMDKARAQKLINNLLSNAIKYSDTNTAIDIALESKTLHVSNQGEGISKENQAKIFERYVRKSKQEGGFGIGLNIVQTVCEMYRIRIEVDSTPHQSTTFRLRFP